jgi:hypothetical protein
MKQSSSAQATTASFSRRWKFCSGHYRCCNEDLRADVERELEERTGAVHAFIYKVSGSILNRLCA